MIVFDLRCRDAGHQFEAWFRSSADFAMQAEKRLLVCPNCGSGEIEKAVMAPSVGRKGNQIVPVPAGIGQPTALAKPAAAPGPVATIPPQAREMFVALMEAQKAALEKSRWVGENFAEEAKAMHYGERDHAPIHGQATPDEVEDLLAEGVEIAPLPFPVAPPDAVN